MHEQSAHISTEYKHENALLLHICANIIADVHAHVQSPFIRYAESDWDYIFRRAYQHGIAPLIYYGIQRFREDLSIPLAVLEKFKKSCITTQLINQKLLTIYQKICSVFHAEQIPLIPYKGIALISSVYASIDQRPMSDIDLLLKKEDIARARHVLERMGFRVAPYNILFKEKHFHLTFLEQNARNGIVVELHWHIDFTGSPYALCIDDVWSRAKQVDSSQPIYLPEIHDDILLNLYHLLRDPTQDKVIPLKNCVDVAMLIQKHHNLLNWNILYERAQLYALLRLVSFGLALLHRLRFISEDEGARGMCTPCCVPAELVDGIIQEKIFQDMEKEPYLPDGFMLLPRGKKFFRLDIKTIFNTITYHLINEYITRKSLSGYLKKLTAVFFSAFKNYCLVVWLLLRKPHQFWVIVGKKVRKTNRLQHIESWLQGK